MGLDKAALGTSLQAAIEGFWTAAQSKISSGIKAQLDAAASSPGTPGDAPTQRQDFADEVANAVTTDLISHISTVDFAAALADAIDTYVRGGEIVIALADVGLQTSTAVGSPTGPPAAPKTLTNGLQ